MIEIYLFYGFIFMFLIWITVYGIKRHEKINKIIKEHERENGKNE